jgi:hypothetical protein
VKKSKVLLTGLIIVCITAVLSSVVVFGVSFEPIVTVTQGYDESIEFDDPEEGPGEGTLLKIDTMGMSGNPLLIVTLNEIYSGNGFEDELDLAGTRSVDSRMVYGTEYTENNNYFAWTVQGEEGETAFVSMTNILS